MRLRVRAEAGDADAQNNLGFMYDFGEGVPQNYAEAARWFRLAADQGHADAQGMLGVLYNTGRGVPQDNVQAHMWYNLVAARNTGWRREQAVEARDLIADELTPDDLNEAQRLAREWDAAHPRDSPRPR
jgi:TPR repeat protein